MKFGRGFVTRRESEVSNALATHGHEVDQVRRRRAEGDRGGVTPLCKMTWGEGGYKANIRMKVSGPVSVTDKLSTDKFFSTRSHGSIPFFAKLSFLCVLLAG